QPLGRVLSGFGNNGEDGFEGVRRGNLIGTYLHGPLLPKNAWLADRLIAAALERRYGERPPLEPLNDSLERAAHESAPPAAARRAALGWISGRWSRSRRRGGPTRPASLLRPARRARSARAPAARCDPPVRPGRSRRDRC